MDASPAQRAEPAVVKPKRRRRARGGFLSRFHSLSYTLVLLGLLPLFTAEAVPFLLLPPALAVLGIGFLRDEGRIRFEIPRLLWVLATSGILLLSALRVVREGDQAATFLNVILYLQAYRLLHPKTNREWPQIYLMSFFMLLMATALTPRLSLALWMFFYVLAASWALTVFQIKRGIDEAASRRRVMAEEAAGGEGAAKSQNRDKGGKKPAAEAVAEPWTNRAKYEVEAGGIVRPSFLAFTALFTLGTFIATFPVFFAIPRLSRRFMSTPLIGMTVMTGFTDEMSLGAVGRIQANRAQAMSIVPMGGKLPDPNLLYIRGLALNRYDGFKWRRDGLETAEMTHLGAIQNPPYAFTLWKPKGRALIDYTVYLEPMGTATLFGIDRLSTLVGDFPTVQKDDGESIQLKSPPMRQFKYIAKSALAGPGREDREQGGAPRGAEAEERKGPTGIRVRWLELPEIEPEIRELSQRVTAGIENPEDMATAIEEYLDTSFGYTLDLPWTGGDHTPLYDFLFVAKRGPCDFFATAMAIFLRLAGVPARVVYGFHGGEWNPVAEALIVRQSNAHVWVEALMPEGDWVRFDPTPAAPMAQAAGTNRPAGTIDTYLQAARMAWYRYVVDFSYQDQVNAITKMNQLGEIRALRARAALRGLSRMSPGKKVLLPIALLLAIVLFWKAGDLKWRLPRRIRGRLAGPASPASAIAFYERMLALLEKKGVAKPAHLTAREFAETLAERGSPLAPPVRDLTGIYQQVRFGGTLLTPEDRRAVLVCLDAIRKGKPPEAPGMPGTQPRQ